MDSKDASGGRRRGGARTILLVEDEPHLRRVTRRVLERAGYAVLEAESPDRALAITSGHEGPVGLLLTDIKLPDGDGRELAQRLRRERPDVEVLFMSGYTDDILNEGDLRMPTAAFLQKPYTVSELLSKVRALLDR